MSSRWFILWGLAAIAGCGDCGGARPEVPSPHGASRVSPPSSEGRDGDTDTTACPVCGLEMKKMEAPFRHEHAGRVYYFFLEDHRNAFAIDPDSYMALADDDTEDEKATITDSSP